MDTAPTTSFHRAVDPSSRRADYPSALLAEPRDSTGSSVSYHEHHSRRGGVATDADDSRPVTLGLSIRRTRLVVFTAVMLSVIVGLTLWFHHGFAVAHFDSRDKNTTEQTKLLDDYNSYSGNIASIFATPIELFVTVAVQVIVLRFMADTFTRPEMSWKISAFTLLIGAGVGYMISNGFNALNVLLRPENTRTVISAVDLGASNFGQRLDHKFIVAYPTSESEMTPNNNVTNTVLRTALVPETPIGAASCKYSEFRDGVSTLQGTVDQVDATFLNLGIPQWEWQSRILQKALPSETLRVIINPTNKSINDAVNISAFPMPALRAAVLFNTAMTTGTYFFPWGSRRDYVNKTELLLRLPVKDAGQYNFSDMLPQMNGLLPMDDKLAGNETAQRAFFIPAAIAAASRQFAKSNRTKTSNISLDFSHTQIAPNITFDALTFEVELDPTLLATTIDGQHDAPTYRAVEPMYDSAAQVVAFRMCTNWNGSEVMQANVTVQNNTITRHIGSCADDEDGHLLTRSLLIMSIGKRLVADALEQNVSVSANGTQQNTRAATITNLRKIYTFTVGRLGWEYTDLKDLFQADECEAGHCRGLALPLAEPLGSATTVASGKAQRLIVGEVAVRHAQLGLQRPSSRVNFDKTTLVSVAEPPRLSNASDFYQAMAGDLLLPHNVGKITWDRASVHPSCDAEAENRIMRMRAQHQYMEHSLQAAYTASTYFLFQSGVVRDVITLSSERQSLAFQHNSQLIDVWVSTPMQNTWLTLAGCMVLVAGLVGAVVKAMWFTPKEKDALANITEPHAIARVMMDERHYPPLFLHRQVVDKQAAGRVDEFAIAALSLQQQQQRAEAQIRGKAERIV